ncbi:alpha-galactosidase [Klebsormidium nitens]|uniref:Alpha-galactosidase n=1 Tax=Klebsormidium nitens TaxID=105231 RepID=A0A1Y1HV11_KLENI|nr:alpha-galactosidase [Klebsormidium nitens]|eukprot:GAQ82465.1 alpha-galactosidase [Klebsormidium nitens]
MAGRLSLAAILVCLMLLAKDSSFVQATSENIRNRKVLEVDVVGGTSNAANLNVTSEGDPLRRNMLANGLNATPRMGWSTWNAYGTDINEAKVKQAADQVVALGLRDAGYVYINIDDGWNTVGRSPSGDLQHDPSVFPSGMLSLGNYIHGKGLKFGLYLDAGQLTCAGREGSLGFEARDARYLQAATVDYLKYDSCASGDVAPIRTRFEIMRDALAALSRPIYYSTGYWGYPTSTCDRGSVANSWRTFYDIYGDINRVFETMDQNNMYPQCAGPSQGWNDPDYLVVGGLGLSDGSPDYVGERTQMSIWAIMKAPLMISIQLAAIDATRQAILTNSEVIAVNQDSLGVQASRTYYAGKRQIWAGPLSGNRVVVALVNENGGSSDSFSATWTVIGLTPGTVVTARDLWAHQNLPGTYSGSIGPFSLQPHESVLLVLTIQSGSYNPGSSPPISGCSPSYPYLKYPYLTKCGDVAPSMPQPCNSPDGPGSFAICCPSACGGLDTDGYSPICQGYPGTCTDTPAPPANTPAPPAKTPSPTPGPPSCGPPILSPGSTCSGGSPNPCYASDGSKLTCCPGTCGPFASDGTPTCVGVSGVCSPNPTPAPPTPTSAPPNPTPAPTNPGPNPTPAPTNPGPNPTPAPANPGPNPPCGASRPKLAAGSACGAGAVNPCYDSNGANLICCPTACGPFGADGNSATCQGDTTNCAGNPPATNPPVTSSPGTNPPVTNPPVTTPSPPAGTSGPPGGMCTTYPYPKSSDGASCNANLANPCYDSGGNFFICCPSTCGAFLSDGNPTCIGYPTNCTP